VTTESSGMRLTPLPGMMTAIRSMIRKAALAAVRRRLRLGPRSRSVIRRPLRPHVRSGAADMNIVEKDVDKAVDKGRALAEWHDMTPGQQAAWAELRAWVAWLHDRYELGTEDRLPRCWPRHPGAGRCPDVRRRVPDRPPGRVHAGGRRPGARRGMGTRLPARGGAGDRHRRRAARLAGECLTTATVAAALDSGDASAVPLLRDYVFYAGAWWMPASSGWVKVPRPGRVGESFPLSPQTSGTDSPAPGSSGDPWQE
jgi:hypothetical protein